jgi:hypothetical protein
MVIKKLSNLRWFSKCRLNTMKNVAKTNNCEKMLFSQYTYVMFSGITFWKAFVTKRSLHIWNQQTFTVFLSIYHDPHVPPWIATLTWLWSLQQWEGSAHARELGEAATKEGGMPRHILDELLTVGSKESLLSMKATHWNTILLLPHLSCTSVYALYFFKI